MKKLLKNYKTTSAGVLMILGAISTLIFHDGPISQELFMGAATGLLGGLGLIFSKDFNVTGDGN